MNCDQLEKAKDISKRIEVIEDNLKVLEEQKDYLKFELRNRYLVVPKNARVVIVRVIEAHLESELHSLKKQFEEL